MHVVQHENGGLSPQNYKWAIDPLYPGYDAYMLKTPICVIRENIKSKRGVRDLFQATDSIQWHAGTERDNRPPHAPLQDGSCCVRRAPLKQQEAQLSLRDRATRACQLKSGKVLHKCRRLVFEKL